MYMYMWVQATLSPAHNQSQAEHGGAWELVVSLARPPSWVLAGVVGLPVAVVGTVASSWHRLPSRWERVRQSLASLSGRCRVPSVSPSTVGADTARSDAARLLNGRERPGRRGGPALLGWKCHRSPGV